MKFAGLYSAGKDSTFAISSSIRRGHELSCLIILHPMNDESMLYHYPNNHLLGKIANVFEVPPIEIRCNAIDKDSEIKCLEEGINEAIKRFDIEALCHGCISSQFQMNIFKSVALKFNLDLLSPLWKIDTDQYYEMLFENKFEIILTRVAANGLNEHVLGKEITPIMLRDLRNLSIKYGFNLNFEGGEAETLVLNCPFYKKRLRIKEAKILWDGIRGIFEISDVDLIEKKRPDA